MRIVFFMDVARADFDDGVVEARMGELGDEWIGLHLFQVTEQISLPGPRLMHVPILLDEVLEFLILVHSREPPL